MKCVWCLLLLLFQIQIQAGFVELKDGRLIKGDIGWEKSKISSSGEKFSLSDVLSFETDRPLASGSGEYIQLKNGSLIKGKSQKIDLDKSIVIFEVNGTDREVPLNLIKALSFDGCRYIDESKLKGPGFILKNGQALDGKVAYFTRTMVGRTIPSKMRFKKNALSHILMDKSPGQSPEIKVFTTSREIFCGSSAEIKDGSLHLKYPLGNVVLNLSSVFAYQRLKGGLPLNGESLKNVKQQPFLKMVKKPLFNSSFTGEAINFNGFPLEKFLSLHSRTELTVKAVNGAKWFRTRAFIDPSVSKGDMELKIMQKGKELFRSRISSDKPYINVNVKINGGELQIIADYGERGSSGDYLILANPRFSVEK